MRSWIYITDGWTEEHESNSGLLILSLESVISVIAGFLVLHQNLSQRELIGCALMFIAIILAQLPGEN